MYFSIILLRKAEKEEERRAREKIRQKVEEDKVDFTCLFALHIYFSTQTLKTHIYIINRLKEGGN